MKESVIYFIWENQVFNTNNIKSISGHKIKIIDVGCKNNLSGPDYTNCKIKIDDKIWVGDVEIHLKSSDWKSHNHNLDDNYNNVILHVVYSNNSNNVKTKDNNSLFTLEIKDIMISRVYNNYKKFINKNNKSNIYCSDNVKSIDNYKIRKWINTLYINRLNNKINLINEDLVKNNNNWELTLLKMMARGFGLKLNKDVFMELFSVIPHNVIVKESNDINNLEAIFFGTVGLLKDPKDNYARKLKDIYDYICIKHSLEKVNMTNKVNFFKCYPSNYPTIRLSQIANLINKNKNFFFKLVNLDFNKKNYYDLFEGIRASKYWETHFVFEGKETRKKEKRLSRDFIDILILNVFMPITILYKQKYGENKINYVSIYSLMRSIKPEKNNIVKKFYMLGFPCDSALDTQGILELNQNYCSKRRCMECDIGKDLMFK